MKIKNYVEQVTVDDQLYIFFIQDHGKILKFAVQYSTKIDGKWRSVMRADNFHGTPHRHIFHLHSGAFKVELSDDANMAFTSAQREIRDNLQAIKHNFLFSS